MGHSTLEGFRIHGEFREFKASGNTGPTGAM